jgi:uncharacterized heparinase superfamily protein
VGGAGLLSRHTIGAARRVLGQLAARIYASPLYAFTLRSTPPRRLARLPPPPWPGDAERGRAIISGRLVCGGSVFDGVHPDWFEAGTSHLALAELHSFDWLDDLAASSTPDARVRARDLIGAWLQEAGTWHALAWAPSVLARRVAAWLAHARFISSGDDDPLSVPFLDSLARQTRHLARTSGSAPPGLDRLHVARGLVYAGLCGFDERAARGGLEFLNRELAQQMLPDGGHVVRSPELHARALACVVDIRAMLGLAGWPVPSAVSASAETMAPLLRLFRHGDGGLALFNRTTSVEPAFLDAVLARADIRVPAPAYAPQTGYARLAAGQTVVITDIGAPPPPPFDVETHAGTLSFEMSYGRERIIVNCGTRAQGEWRSVARMTAAHSTAVIDDTNSSELLPEAGLGRRPQGVAASFESAEGALWTTASHDGYRPVLDATHRRRLYLSADGNDLRGEDCFSGGHRGTFAVRFHLHPNVRASLVQNAAAVLLQSASGGAWRMQAANGALSLAESIYLGTSGPPWRCEQIVISGRMDGGETVVKWALRRIPAT